MTPNWVLNGDKQHSGVWGIVFQHHAALLWWKWMLSKQRSQG